MGKFDSQEFKASKWVKSTFLGWLLGFIFILILSVGLGSIGIDGVQFFTGTGMGAGVGFMQWRLNRRTIIKDKKWIWFSALGLTIPFLFYDLLNLFNDYTLGTYLLPLCTGLGGIIVGLFQFRMLNGISRKPKLWILASTIGWFFAVLTVSGMEYTNHITTNNMAGFAINILLILVGGIVLGIITGMFLRKILK